MRKSNATSTSRVERLLLDKDCAAQPEHLFRETNHRNPARMGCVAGLRSDRSGHSIVLQLCVGWTLDVWSRYSNSCFGKFTGL